MAKAPQGTRDIYTKPILPQPGDTRAGHGCWEALGTQTLQPEGQHVSTNHPECPLSRAWCHLMGTPRCWWLPGVLMGVSSVGPCARGSPGPGSDAGRKPFPGRNSATSTPPAVAWPWTHLPTFDPLPPPSLRGFNPFYDPSRSWWRTWTLRMPLAVGKEQMFIIPPVLCYLHIF